MDINKVSVVFAVDAGGAKRRTASFSVVQGALADSAEDEATRVGKLAQAAWDFCNVLYDEGVVLGKPLFVKGFQVLSQQLDDFDEPLADAIGSFKGIWYSAANDDDTKFRRWQAMRCTLPLADGYDHDTLVSAISDFVAASEAKAVGYDREDSTRVFSDTDVYGYWTTNRGE